MPHSAQLGYPGERHPCSSAFIQSNIRGWKWERDVSFMSKEETNPPFYWQNHPPIHLPAKSCFPLADSLPVQSLIVKINYEVHWIFTSPDAWVSAASLWAAHPVADLSLCPHPQASCVPKQ